ncbi:hypothetical protein [Pseudolysinimonas yzui]|uniref:Uncharacterized protein n=1 Tax=Pseudolysinimonas yzui TaxID=2708254 RepID=A0A8J3GSY7_9MICO|nr:hypothetical protein [Pseudolysinimonas yzui]GHF26860.1 hypothetical protein GCM10011600_29730 [Pseudolysinimonas yzui]
MTARVVILAALALSLIVAGFGALWLGTVGMLGNRELTSALVEDQEEWARHEAWLNMLWSVPSPFIGAGLIAGIGALALVVRARQLAQARTEPLPTTSPGSLRQS